MKKILLAVVMGSTLLASGCATQTGLIKKNSQTVPKHSESQSFLFWGIGQEKTLNAAQICGSADKVAKVQTVQEPMDIILGVITMGIYAPRTANVYCQ